MPKSYTRPPDTPPEDVKTCSWQVSWLAGRGGFPAFPALVAPVEYRMPLTAYSCGGSPGLIAGCDVPGSLLAPDIVNPRIMNAYT